MKNRSIQTNGIIIFSFRSNAAAPDGAPPLRISEKNSDLHCPAVPRRGPEAGNSHTYYDFHGNLSALPPLPGVVIAFQLLFFIRMSQNN